jgi:hypothetical protein
MYHFWSREKVMGTQYTADQYLGLIVKKYIEGKQSEDMVLRFRSHFENHEWEERIKILDEFRKHLQMKSFTELVNATLTNKQEVSMDRETFLQHWNGVGEFIFGLQNLEESTTKRKRGLLKAVPEAAVPEATVPEAAVPEVEVLEAAVPEAAVPEAAVPEAAVPEAAVPEAAVPEAAVLEPMRQEPPCLGPTSRKPLDYAKLRSEARREMLAAVNGGISRETIVNLLKSVNADVLTTDTEKNAGKRGVADDKLTEFISAIKGAKK